MKVLDLLRCKESQFYRTRSSFLGGGWLVVGVGLIRLCYSSMSSENLFPSLIMDQRGSNKKTSYRDRSRSVLGNRWVMSSDNDNNKERVDDAMLVEEDRQPQRQSLDDASSTKLVCRKDTSERALTKALKTNIGNSIGTSIANLIVELSNHAYRKQLDKAPDYFSIEDTKKTCNGRCIAKLNRWFAQLRIAHEDIANYLVKMCNLSDKTGEGEEEVGIMTIAELYTRDIRNIIQIVILKEKLFNNSRDRTIISRGLVKFDSIVDAISTSSSYQKLLDRSEVLYAAIASEGKDDATDALIQLNKFKELVTTMFCPRVTQILIKNLNLGAVNAVYAFSEIVKYVEKFNTVNGKLPGIEFRNLLAGINIKILESDITLERERQKEENFQFSIGKKTASATAVGNRKTNEATKRNLIRALKTISESKPLSDSMPMHQDTASDVLSMPNSAELANVPLPPVDLLMVTNYVNSFLSLEKMAVFTPGTFKSTCMMINQCLSPSHIAMTGQKEEEGGGSIVESLASKIAKKDVLDAIKTSNNVKKKKKEKAEIESSDGEGENNDHSGSYGSDTEDSENESDDEETSRKKKKLSMNVNFFTDNSIILNSIRGFMRKKHYKNMIDFINETASDANSSENTKDYIISALTDALVSTLEERDTLKHSVQCQRSILPKTETSKLTDKLASVMRDIVNFESNKAEILTFMLSDVDRMAIFRHESVLFNQRLIPSNSKNSTDDLIDSFFNQPSVEEMVTEENAFCPIILPKINDFAVAVTAQAVMLIQAFTVATSTGESEDKIKKLRSLRIPGGVPDPIRDNNVSELMDKYSSLTSKPRELLKSRLVAVVTAQPSSSRLLYPSSSNNKNDEDAFTRTIRWQGLVNRIESQEEVKVLRNNVVSASSDESLSKLLFPASIEEERRGREEERGGTNNTTTDRLTTVVDALFSLIDATSRLVFDVEERKVVLVLDDSFLDRVVDYLYKTYNASASAVYRDAVKSSPSPHYYYEEEKNNNDVGGDCPSIFARRLATAISEDFLKRINMKTSSSNQAVVDPSKKTAEAGLVKEISDRASDIVKSQIANVVITTVLINAARRLQYMDERRVEMMSANNEEIPVALLNAVNYISSAHDREARKGLTKSVNRLSVYICLSAARDMLRLSNGYFFSVLRESGVKTSGRSEGNVPEERSSADGTGRKGTPSWLYTALKNTLIGKPLNEVRDTGIEKGKSEKTNIMELLNEII